MLKDIYASVIHPRELVAMLKVKLSSKEQNRHHEPLSKLALQLSDKAFCYASLNKVSRSFALVIQQLPDKLKDPVCLFYLILRVLDTLEDDMKFDTEEKLPLLRNFYQYIGDEKWYMKDIGDTHDYRMLLTHYPKIARVFQTLDPAYQDVIRDITKKMGNGMADFSVKKVCTLEEYDQYCHYVAGLVGMGLSDLFAVSGYENDALREELRISNSMGLFLQKTNIIRDYHEDLFLGRSFWPAEIWTQYASHFDRFANAPESPDSLACLNHLVLDTLRHIPDCINYMRKLTNKQVFRFCAIPQVMAIATLAEVYNNPKVFKGVVKIRKGLASKLMLYTNDMNAVIKSFKRFMSIMIEKTNPNDPHFTQLQYQFNQIFQLLDSNSAVITPEFKIHKHYENTLMAELK